MKENMNKEKQQFTFLLSLCNHWNVMINVEKYVNKFDTLNFSFYFTNSNQIELYNALFIIEKERKKERPTDKGRDGEKERGIQKEIDKERERE